MSDEQNTWMNMIGRAVEVLTEMNRRRIYPPGTRWLVFKHRYAPRTSPAVSFGAVKTPRVKDVGIKRSAWGGRIIPRHTPGRSAR